MIVQAAMTMLVLLGLSAFVVDYGVLWVARTQAQNAADAGAVAGAITQAYDDPAVVGASVSQTVAANPVWFDPVATSSNVSLVCPAEVAAGIPCVKVDVYRDGTNGSNSLPTFFAPVLNITSQRVRATATAQVAVGNGTTCLKPWAIPDKWSEGSAPPNDNFEEWNGAGMPVMNPDGYDPPTEMGPGSGFRYPKNAPPGDLGLSIILSFPDPAPGGADPITQGFLLPLNLPGPKTYAENIADCNSRFAGFDQDIEIGATAATTADFEGLINADLGASWNPITNNVEGSCAPRCATVSPRLVALAVFDVGQYQLLRATGGTCAGGVHCVSVVNIVGFFLDHVAGVTVVGYLARYPGLLSPGNPTLSSTSSFLPAITLVR